MKKIKLLIPALSSLSLVGVTSAALTSCSCIKKSNAIEIYEKTNKIYGNEKSGKLQFSLKNRLSKNQRLEVKETSETGYFAFNKQKYETIQL